MTNYLGYNIKYVGGHVEVTAPDGSKWTEDTVEDAIREINDMVCAKAREVSECRK